MPSSYTSNLGLEKPADGEQDGIWGGTVNDNMNIIDRGVNGVLSLALTGTASNLTTTDGVLSDGQFKLLVLTGTLAATHTVTIVPNTADKIYYVRNTTAQSVVFTQGSGGNTTIASGDSAIIYANGVGAGSAVANLTDHFAMSSVNITGGTIDGTAIGGTTAAAISGTTGTFSGDVTIADRIVHSGDPNTTIRFPAADTVTVETGGAERLRVENSGEVGIGTNAPTALLHMVGSTTAAADTVLRVQVGNTDGSSILAFGDTADTYIGGLDYRHATDSMAVVVNNATRATVTSAGNLGVGETTPAARLHVKDSTAGSVLIVESTEAGATAAPDVVLRRTSASPADNDFLASVDFQGRNSINGDVSYAQIVAQAEDITELTEDGRLHFYTTQAGSSAVRMTITSDGFVGIGTTSPTTALQVVGTSTLAATNLTGAVTVTEGVTTTADNDGTISSGTYTPTPVGGNMKRIVNGGAFTLAEPTASGDYTLVIQITNNASAGAITLSGFTKTTGNPFTTTNGHDFFVYITKCNGFTLANVVALQ
jgi:hypothetical protein